MLWQKSTAPPDCGHGRPAPHATPPHTVSLKREHATSGRMPATAGQVRHGTHVPSEVSLSPTR